MHKLLMLISLVASIVAVPPSNLERPEHEASTRLANATSHPATISQRYIISLKPNNVDPHARGAWLNTVLSSNNHARRDLSSGANFDLKLTWNETLFHGFAGTFSEAEIQTLRAQDEVNYIEPDHPVYAAGLTLQENAPWGLSRICTGRTPLPAGSSPDRSDYGYLYHERAGSGVDIYVLDTGVRPSHLELAGRAQFLGTFSEGVRGVDIHGHGTHVACIVAGAQFGAARKANIIAIKVLDDDTEGWSSDMISGINLVVDSAASTRRPSIINLSMGTSPNQSVDDAATRAVNLGILIVASAGNGSEDASNTSPGRLGGAGGNPGIITVGSTTIYDSFSWFSNFGPRVDVLAPGTDIWSCWASSDYAFWMNSGTSIATPHVSGLAALIMGEHGKLTPQELKRRIIATSVPNLIHGVPLDTPNLLAYSGYLGRVGEYILE